MPPLSYVARAQEMSCQASDILALIHLSVSGQKVSCPRDLCRKTCCGGTAWPLLSIAPRPGKGIVAPEVGEKQSELLILPGPWVGAAQPSTDLAMAIKKCVPSNPPTVA